MLSSGLCAGFAHRLQNSLPVRTSRAQKTRRSDRHAPPSTAIPDVCAELAAKGEEEFRLWLRSLDLSTLKAIIKMNGFDPGKASQRWTDPNKFVALVAGQAVSRVERGSTFLPPQSGPRSVAPPSPTP
jgi:hypothetical protein